MKRLLIAIIILSLLPNVSAQIPGGCPGLQSPYTFRYVPVAQLPGGCLNSCFDPVTDVVSVCGSTPNPPVVPPKPPII